MMSTEWMARVTKVYIIDLVCHDKEEGMSYGVEEAVKHIMHKWLSHLERMG